MIHRETESLLVLLYFGSGVFQTKADFGLWKIGHMKTGYRHVLVSREHASHVLIQLLNKLLVRSIDRRLTFT